MDKVFSEPSITKFDVRKLSDIGKPASVSKLDADPSAPSSSINPRITDQDYDSKLA